MDISIKLHVGPFSRRSSIAVTNGHIGAWWQLSWCSEIHGDCLLWPGTPSCYIVFHIDIGVVEVTLFFGDCVKSLCHSKYQKAIKVFINFMYISSWMASCSYTPVVYKIETTIFILIIWPIFPQPSHVFQRPEQPHHIRRKAPHPVLASQTVAFRSRWTPDRQHVGFDRSAVRPRLDPDGSGWEEQDFDVQHVGQICKCLFIR